MNEIKFSIIVPIFKVEKYLEDSILSIINQTYSNWEAILVNDGSPDNCHEICKKYQNKYSDKIKYIKKKNGGILSARVSGLEVTTGNYIMFLDGDDTYEKNTLETIEQYLRKYKDIDCIIFNTKRVINNKVVSYFPEQSEEIITDKKELFKKVISGTEYNSLGRKVIKSSVIVDRSNENELRDYMNINLGEDLLFSLKIYQKAYKFLFIKEYLYRYTINPNSITQTINPDSYRVDFTVRQLVVDILNKLDIFNEVDWINYRRFGVLLICNEIITIFNFKLPLSSKIKLCEKIKKDNYYNSFISKYKFNIKTLDKRDIVFALFKHNMYSALDIIVRLNRFLKNLLKR